METHNTVDRRKSRKTVAVLAMVLFAGLLATYWNHFDNEFHFDDFHTITQNPYIKDIKNIPRFFTDYTETQSTRPVIKTYRPLVTTFNAISYWLGDDYNTFYFHLTIFILFILQLFLMYFLFRKIMDLMHPHHWNPYIALFATAWYAFHTATAETVNYIIARSDSMSTMLIVMALVVWAYFPRQRKYGFYLIPALLGLFTKEQSAMFAPLLLMHILYFEQDLSIPDIFCRKRSVDLWKGIKKALPAIIIFLVITYIIVFVVRVSKEPDYGHTAAEYARTQPYVWLHYFITFFYPYKLSADPDMAVFRDLSDWRMWAGFLFMILYLFTIVKTSMKKSWRPVSFGLVWFGIALFPTSSIFPLGQISNDHRMFFPFVGLVLSVSWTIGLLLFNYEMKIKQSGILKILIPAAALLLIVAHAIGTYNRNVVWDSERSLWYDAIQKSPKNERALMNYGLTLMSNAEYKEARDIFLKAYDLNPDYNYLLVNLGILYNAMDKKDSSEFFFQKALRISPKLHVTNYYYGRHLFQQNKLQQARKYVERALETVPHYLPARHLMMNILFHQEDWETLSRIAGETLEFSRKDELAEYFLQQKLQNEERLRQLEQKVKQNPEASDLINLSLIYYKNKEYEKVIDVCRKALTHDPNLASAYNNIGSAYIAMKQYKKAVKPLQKALDLNPGLQRARNNLLLARSELSRESVFDKNLTFNEWINMSLVFYKQEDYEKCIRCCRKALEIRPNSAEAWNNICSAYNKMGEYTKAVEACKKALKIKPDMERAKNNLAFARQNL